MAAPPPLSPLALADIHRTVQTTTNTIEPAPELLLTRGCEKRSLAALEPEFVDSNDINGMAPSSAVLQSDFLIMDDSNNLEDKADMTSRIHSISTAPSPLPPQKRVRYAHSENEPTASDFAQLEPVIQPYNKTEVRSQSNRGLGSRQHPPSERMSSTDPLLPAGLYMDEPEGTIYSEPLDCSSGLTLDTLQDIHTPSQDLTSKHPESKPSVINALKFESPNGKQLITLLWLESGAVNPKNDVTKHVF